LWWQYFLPTQLLFRNLLFLKPVYRLAAAGITTVKFVYIHWVGDHVQPMQKARSTVHKGACSAFFEVCTE
jgi:hypothetical protein